ncbi:MAG: 4Fe-4S binding protein [Melioribacteraceae bacterium]|jgi:NADH:ubiquinone oxidoreductase subunit F (NADH-binding)/Pyruvate/2-oxoacid:ferredoxin oxidoreductase delta subunit/(2Fe-2S) ferredoxin|nr:4Fe-4S binding protein [Melioribacteraceae bacterium]
MSSFIELVKCDKCEELKIRSSSSFISECKSGLTCEHSDNINPKIITLNQKLTYKEHSLPIIFIGMGTCGLASGANKVKRTIEEELIKLNIEATIVPTGCIGFCAKEVIVDIKLPTKDRISYCEITPKDVPALLKKTIIDKQIYIEKLLATFGKTDEYVTNINEIPFFIKQQKIVLENCGIINPTSIDEYIANGGFAALEKVLLKMTSQDVVNEILNSGIRGRGGGGFPTGKKWNFALSQKIDKKYIICNADEGDPGAFMDRSVLESDPFKLIEGMIIAAYAIGASSGYIYCRAEYPLAIERLNNAITKCKEYGLIGESILGSNFNLEIKIIKGAGGFVCGEETALIASIEGKRGMPKPRPPFPAVSGLWGKPTIINNVETLSNISSIINKGSEWYSSIGTKNSKGTKVFAISGKVKYSGLAEVPMGITLGEVVFEIGGGVPNNKKFKAVQIGGPSGGCLPLEAMHTPVDYESIKEIGAMMGSGGFVIMDEDTCIVDLAKFFLQFIKNESCGKCVPCREGTTRMLEIIERISTKYGDGDPLNELQRFKGIIHLERLASVIQDTSLCGLGQSAPNPVLSGLKYFREEYEEHLYERKCSAKVCKDILHYTIDPYICNGCGACLRKCATDAIIGVKKEAHTIIQTQCTKCGVCIETCRFDAISVN